MIENSGIDTSARRVARRAGVTFAACLLVSAAVAQAATDPAGFLTQPTGRSSCINEDGSSHCLQGHGFGSSFGIAVDPAGQHAYVTSFNQLNTAGHALGSLVVLDRFPTAASLLQSGAAESCLATNAADGCNDGRDLLGAFAPVVSPDGKNVYVATQDGVASFKRDATTGRVTQLPGEDGCLNEAGSGGCQPARMVQNASNVLVSPNGKSVYVAAFGPVPTRLPYQPTRSGVAVFARDPDTGALTQLSGTSGCITEDGASGCALAPGLLGSISLAMPPDGQTLYVGSIKEISSAPGSATQAGAVTALSVDATSGVLSAITGHGGCLAEGPVAGCDQARGLRGVTSVIAPANDTVYAVGHFSDAVAVLRRSSTGRLAQPTTGTDGADGCSNATGAEGCATAPSLDGARVAIASHDGFHIYVGGGDNISTFRRAERGRLVQLAEDFGCISQGGAGTTSNGCFVAHGLLDIQALAIDPLDRYLYAATSGNQDANSPGGGVVTLVRNAHPPPLTLSAKLQTSSCRATTFVVDLVAKSPLPVRISASIDGHSVRNLPRQSSLRLRIRASAYKPGMHRLKATARDISGRVRNTSLHFRRCRPAS